MKKQTKKGFTLVELVIVIAVIAILSAILIPTFGNVIADANKKAAKEDARTAYQEFLVANAEKVSFAGDEVFILVEAENVDKDAGSAKYAYTVEDGTLTELTVSEGKTNLTQVVADLTSKKPATHTEEFTNLTVVEDYKLEATLTKDATFGKAYKLKEGIYLVFTFAD